MTTPATGFPNISDTFPLIGMEGSWAFSWKVWVKAKARISVVLIINLYVAILSIIVNPSLNHPCFYPHLPTGCLPVNPGDGLQAVGFVKRDWHPKEFVLIVLPLDFPYVPSVVGKSTVFVSCNLHGRDPSVRVSKIPRWRRPSPHIKIPVFLHGQFNLPLISDAQD